MPRGVPNARNSKELHLLIGLVSQHIEDVLCPYRDALSRQKKLDSWSFIEKEFNSSKERSRRATRHELQLIWNSLKLKAKRQRNSAGPNSPLSDPLTSAVDRVLQENGEPQAQSEDEESSTESEQETPENSEETPGNGPKIPGNATKTPGNGANNVSGYKAVVTTTRNPAVNYCPRREFMSTVPGTQVKILRPPAPGSRRSAFTPCLSPSQPPYHDQIMNHQPFVQPQNTFRPIANAPPSVQTRPVVTSSPSSFFPAGSQNFTVYAPPVSAMAPPAPGSLPRTTFNTVPTLQVRQPAMTPPSTQHSPLHIENPPRAQYLQDAQTHIRIRHIQALNSMEKTLNENRIRMEEMLATWAKELHVARIQSHAVSREGNAHLDRMLDKRDQELHLAKMRVEETIASKQRELHDIKIETAKVEHQLAEINKKIFERKLEQAEMELQYVKENGPART